MVTPDDDVPAHALSAASFAESMAAEYARQGGDVKDLFVAFVGLVCSQDRQIGAACLTALEGALLRAAS